MCSKPNRSRDLDGGWRVARFDKRPSEIVAADDCRPRGLRVARYASVILRRLSVPY
jgi:hypothetical protein